MGDVVFKHFQCLSPTCQAFITVKSSEVAGAFDFQCRHCRFHFKAGFETHLFDYDVTWLQDQSVFEQAEFTVSHSDYIAEAPQYKYCLLCYVLKPVSAFDKHSARESGRQGECRLCKQRYNALKNATRISNQHREAADKRRLKLELAGEGRIDSEEIAKRFGWKCFNCKKDLMSMPPKERPLDHTLPAFYLWPLDTATATLLCAACNGEKSGRWPSDFYDEQRIRELAVATGLDYDLLSGKPQFNPKALTRIKKAGYVDSLLVKYAPYMDEIRDLRNRILNSTGLDMFKYASRLNP